jgi:hypothetical protein
MRVCRLLQQTVATDPVTRERVVGPLPKTADSA